MSKILDHIRYTYGHLQSAARGIDNTVDSGRIVSELEEARREVESAIALAKRGELHSGAYVGMPRKAIG